MMANLQGSETLKNLMRAFAGESQARNRYTFGADLCRQQKLYVLEAVFSFTAGQEKEHGEIFWNHMRPVSGQSVRIDAGYPAEAGNDVLQLLRAARHNELEEYDPIYREFGRIAREEGFPDVAASFQQIADIEHTHASRFAYYAELLETDTLFVSDVKCGWMCLNCGHVQESREAPKRCPVCDHEQGWFIRLEMTPYGGEPVLRFE